MRFIWIALLIVLLPMSASAGRRPYLIDYDTPTVPDGDVEIETWLDFILQGASKNQWRWFIGPRWAPHETLEISAFTILAQDSVIGQNGQPDTYSPELWAEQIDLRWRFFSHKTAGALTLQLNTRIAIVNDMAHQISPMLDWATRVGRFGFAAQLGYAAGFAGPTPDTDYHWIVWSAAASMDLVRGQIAAPLQLGVEAFGQWVLTGNNDFVDLPAGTTSTAQLPLFSRSTVNLGPTLSVAKGRLWLTVGGLVGLTAASPQAFIRGMIGVAL